MKKIVLFIISILVVLITVVCVLFFNKKEKLFSLENKYYGGNDIIEIELNELNELLDKKESFGIFIYQPMCVTSSEFEQVLHDFQEQNSITFYKIAFSEVKDDLEFLNYYPSFIIYEKGKMIDFLESDKDKDLKFYQSAGGFKEWFNKYVEMGKNTNKDSQDNSSENDSSSNNPLVKNIELDNVTREDGKVNIYFFWGNGCPHCEEETKFFEDIEKEYGKDYNLYKFEVWYNEENEAILDSFAAAMNDKVTGVPYTIIGNKSFKGFSNNSKDEFIRTIKEQSQNNYDIYFDKIKK